MGIGDTVGIVGLGRIGLPLARNLLDSGFTVRGYRRGDMSAFAAAGGEPVGAPGEIARTCPVVLTCLPSPAALTDVLSGERGILAAAARFFVLVELSTLPLAAKRAAAQAVSEAGGTILDCPLSGTPAMVEQRQAAIFASGTRDAYDRQRPVFDALTDRHAFVGEFGQGTKLKFIANLLVGIHSLAAAEAMALGTRSGFDAAALIDNITSSAGTSKMFEIRAPMMRARQYRPAPGPLESLTRQLEWIQEFAQECGTATPLLDASLAWFRRSLAEGWADADQAALFETLLSADKRRDR